MAPSLALITLVDFLGNKNSATSAVKQFTFQNPYIFLIFNFTKHLMEKTYKTCQSCSMPLNKDPKGGSTNADGSKNSMYCSYCYDKGAFLQPNITVTEMQTFVKGKLKEMGFPGFLAGFFIKGIPKLERWKNKQ
jgi:hypothetical protein